MKQFTLKALTSTRIVNFATVDKSMSFKPSEKYQNPHTAEECKPDLARQKKFLAAIKSNYELGNWGDKEDTATMIKWLEDIIDSVKFTDAQDKNSWIMYQIERYMHRIWMRGTEEQRTEMGIDIDYATEPAAKPKRTRKTTAKKTEEKKEEPKTEAKPKRTRRAPTKKTEEAKPEEKKEDKKPKVNVTTKAKEDKPSGKSDGVQTIDVSVEEEDRNTTETLLLVIQSMVESLTAEARREVLSAICQYMGAYNG